MLFMKSMLYMQVVLSLKVIFQTLGLHALHHMRERKRGKKMEGLKKFGMKRILSLMAVTLTIISFSAGMAFGTDLSELIRVTRNKMTLEINHTKVNADHFVYNDTTYVPLRVVSELLGKEVGWNAITNVASINDSVYRKEELSRLLPAAAGFKWAYSGFAEYSHEMTLGTITDEAARRIYQISGTVGDPSGGVRTADYTIRMQYVIEQNRLIQQKTEQTMMDSKYNRLTLIETPLVAGTYWTEKVIDKTGASRDIHSQITKVAKTSDGFNQYTVRYKDRGSAYYEQRVIREGTGVVSFEKLFELGVDSFSSGYFLYEPDKTVNVNLTLYFPDSTAEKVRPEIRNVPVDNARTAYTALRELVAGPTKAGLYPSMPAGTTVLDLSISNGTCTINFSREFIDNHGGGSAGELMTLASIVNTLTEFPSIKRVMILVEGRAGETLGNILLDKPLERMTDMLGK